MKYVLIGDMHVKKENIEESQRVIDWVISVCQEYRATPVFMGDQYDAMGVKRLEIEEFWFHAYNKINQELGVKSISLTGNHDLSSDAKSSAMTVHSDQTTVVDAMGDSLEGNIGFVGFIRDNTAFILKAHEMASSGMKYIFCHAEFNGAQYENGFYAPGGIDIEQLPPVFFISGHIHKQQKINKAGGAYIIYTGTPRMLTRSDIGEVKGIHIFDSQTGLDFIPTPKEVAEPFVEVNIKEGEEVPAFTATAKTYVNIHGSKDFIKKICKDIPIEAKIRTHPDSDIKTSDVKESEGIPVAFNKYTKAFFNEVDLTIAQAVLDSVYKACPSLKLGV